MSISSRFIDGLEFAKEQLERNIEFKKDLDDKKVLEIQDVLIDLERLIGKSNRITEK